LNVSENFSLFNKFKNNFLFLSGLFSLIFIPESPYFLAWKKGTVEAARPR